MKKRLAIVALLVIGVAILSAGTIAYFTSETTAHNVITSGGVSVTLEEWMDKVDGTPYPNKKAVPVMPGQAVTKIVTVKNTDAEAFVRAKFSVTVINEDNEEMPGCYEKGIIQIECGEKWEQGSDGWYYYSTPLKKGDRTDPLFSEVKFDGPSMTDEYQNCKVEVDVTTQAVQTANNGTSALEAKGWPTEPAVPAEP